MTELLLQSIASELRVHDALASVAVTETAWGDTLRMPSAAEADYRFVFSRERDGEYRIEVEPVGASTPANASLLWYLQMPFEAHNSASDSPSIEATFHAHAMSLVRSRTRIRQRRHWLVWRLHLEREVEPGQWSPVSACVVPRWRRAFRAEAAQHTYQSPPLISPRFDASSA